MPASLYPITLKLERKRVAVIGAGQVALRKVQALLECGAQVRLVAPEAVEELQQLADQDALTWLAKPFASADLDGCALVVAATEDEAVNRAVVQAAHERSLLVNVVDVPELCDFHVPSILRRGPLTVAVSSAGCSPAFSRDFRRQLELLLPASLGPLLELLAEARAEVRRRIPHDVERRMAINSMLAGAGARERFESGDSLGARRLLWALIDQHVPQDRED